MRVRTASSVPRWAVVALVAGLLLAACSDPEEPGTVPRTTPSPSSSSASPTPTTPEAQVEAAVRTYYAELEQAVRSSETSELEPLISKSCPCYRAVEVIRRNAKRGHRTPDAELTVTEIRVHDVVGRTAAAEVNFENPAYDVINADGDVVETIVARKSRVDLSLVEQGGAWIVANQFNLGAT